MVMPVGILLAAGRGTRFGANKLLHPLADGTPLGVASARALRAALERVVAVVRPGDDALAAMLREAGCEILPCARADEGMGASLVCGVAQTGDASGWLIALADMPFIRPETIAAVAAALRDGASIAAPVLPDGRRGHPVGFAAEWLAELRAVDGDAGARRLLQEHATRVRWLRTDDPGCTVDIDRPGDVAEPG